MPELVWSRAKGRSSVESHAALFSCVTALNASCGQESSHMLLAVYRFPISSVPLLQK